MVPATCPECGQRGRMLQIHGTWVDYYVCDDCHAAWTVDYRDPNATQKVITTGGKKTS